MCIRDRQQVLPQHPELLQYTLLQHLSSKDNPSTTSDILAAGCHATAAAFLIRFDIDTHEGERRCNLGSEDVPLSGSTSRSCTGGSVRGTNQGKNVMPPASPRRQGVSSAHPQRYQGFDPTFALVGIIFNYTPVAICQNASYERSCFWRITTQTHRKKS